MIVSKPKGLVKPEVKPVLKNLRGNKVKLQPKCRFCKNLSIFADWFEQELHICSENFDPYIDIEDNSNKIKCESFEWVDELKGVVE